MATLDVTRSYADGEILFQADLDAFLDDIETFVNITKLNDDNLQNNGITGSLKLLTGSVTSGKLATDSVTTSKIQDNAVTTAKILDANVTTPKLANDAVTTVKILDANVTRAKLAAGAIGNLSVTATKTTTYTATINDDVIPVDTSGSAWTLTLFPATGASGRQLTIKKVSTDLNALTITPDGAETIDGASTTTLNTINESLSLISNGTNWLVLERKTQSPRTVYTATVVGWNTINTQNVTSWRDGQYLVMEGTLNLSGPNSGNGAISIGFNGSNQPAGLTIDYTSLATLSFNAALSGNWGTGNTNYVAGFMVTAGGSSNTVGFGYNTVNTAGGVNTAAPLTQTVVSSGNVGGNNNQVSFSRTYVPITGWKA